MSDAKPRSSPKPAERYRRLPAGTHGLNPEEVKLDQRERLRSALVELIAERGYHAVRIRDLTKLARISRPTFYGLYASKEELLLASYDEIAQRTAKTAIRAYQAQGTRGERLGAAIRAFAELAAAEPEGMSLMVLGAFGSGPNVLERRNHTLQALEQSIHAIRSPATSSDASDLTVKIVLGGIREVTAGRLRQGRARELPPLAGELAAWAGCYPVELPAGLQCAPAAKTRARPPEISERALRAEGRLPSGRHDLSREFIVKNQRERIVNATASIVAEKGLSNLTIPEIAKRANVSHHTFYEMYPSKHDAFLGALKVGMHQALLVVGQAYDTHKDDWPQGVAAGLRALLHYLASEPAHSHLILVDTFAASPEATATREESLHAFASYLQPGYQYAAKERPVPAIAPEAIAGGIWQVLHHYAGDERTGELPILAPQLIYAALTPFLGAKDAAKVAQQ
ncbi:MAG: TetR/AcrR family transcriptional regulator [Solirubrobacterales bacterium]